MLKSLLVANRGEIACRIFRTARALGVRTIAVYSDADAGAAHVRQADEALRLGPAAARDSYLDIERILGAARASGAAAIHPGYGFLSENAQFARAVTEAGLIFVGPPADSIAAMGSKILAKTRMRAAGVPVLPGYAGSAQDLETLAREARAAGLPLIVKPAAGGGGKGMQIITTEAEIAPALSAARRLAQSAFGDGALLLERYLAAPRHLEVQVFADAHGHCLHLGDRDCSIQRRHQKLIEEAPAPQVPDEVRARLRSAALVVAREIAYVGAGTVEFLFDGSGFYFMEMNTRLQVEHTVTETITGLDLVEWQLRVASGEALPLRQDEVEFHGHAIEARVCAEDPARGFLPSSGRLSLMQWPQGAGIRVDAGFATADAVPENYDSLLGKVIAAGSTRELAGARLAQALAATRCAGVRSNERYLAAILRTPAFQDVRHSIAYLAHEGAALATAAPVPAEALILAALATVAPGKGRDSANPWDARDGFTPNLPALVRVQLNADAATHTVELRCLDGRCMAARIDAAEPVTLHDLDLDLDIGEGRAALRLGERRFAAQLLIAGDAVHLWGEDGHYVVTREDPRTREFAATAAAGGLTTPLPGVVVSVAVRPGDQVESGAVLMVIEAMKMEHTITAPYAGRVAAVHFAPGERAPEGSALLELERPVPEAS
jgi:3-methylcrotonyl-CoA carboxylase alpha subunit